MIKRVQNFAAMMSGKLDQPMRNHLKNVYASVASATFVAATGSFIRCNGYLEDGLLNGHRSFVFMFMLLMSRSLDDKDDGTRFMYLNGFAFYTGLSIGPLIKAVWDIQPSIVVSALMYTCIIFTCFSLSAVIAPEGKYLAMGAPLMSTILAMLVASILNIFIGSHRIANITLIVGLLAMSAFILCDTHLIMEKFRMGDRDYIWHALILLMDLAFIFKEILILLADKEQGRKKRDNMRNNSAEMPSESQKNKFCEF